eukprot:Plantae.Rhodophyta-Palmaria_palmata.ctg8747.p2 GENE.Plantae.Rhodophyta-Palmaria_palmata.ctg8747~~Plantae.Rhodophyta-Palmaria_palmata.ctg8747.p2  ORF type:complete len:150 (+),score=14.53 Plantae.Rhodophyta-Palmaria_palmata.ctg8747:406-855(+)
MERAVAVRLGVRDVVLRASGDDAEMVAHRVGDRKARLSLRQVVRRLCLNDDAEGEEVVELGEGFACPLEFAEAGVDALDTALIRPLTAMERTAERTAGAVETARSTAALFKDRTSWKLRVSLASSAEMASNSSGWRCMNASSSSSLWIK